MPGASYFAPAAAAAGIDNNNDNSMPPLNLVDYGELVKRKMDIEKEGVEGKMDSNPSLVTPLRKLAIFSMVQSKSALRGI